MRQMCVLGAYPAEGAGYRFSASAHASSVPGCVAKLSQIHLSAGCIGVLDTDRLDLADFGDTVDGFILGGFAG
jgi:hypothetical protein